MMSKLGDILIDLVGSDLTSEEGRVIRVAGARMVWRVALIVFISYAMGWLAIIGFYGFARVEEVNKKIDSTAAPLTASLDKLTLAVNEIRIAQKAGSLQLLRSAIVDAQVKKCKAGKSETAAIYRQMVVEAQERYYAVADQPYPAPSCADL